jgi:hypothetical protein
MAERIPPQIPSDRSDGEMLDWKWSEALGAWPECDNIEPLLELLEAVANMPSPLPADRVKVLIGVIRILHAKQQKRPRGKPAGSLQQWQDPNYVAAWFAENRIATWKYQNGKTNIPESKRTEIVIEVVDYVRGWDFARRKSPSVGRVLELLRGPKSRRI